MLDSSSAPPLLSGVRRCLASRKLLAIPEVESGRNFFGAFYTPDPST